MGGRRTQAGARGIALAVVLALVAALAPTAAAGAAAAATFSVRGGVEEVASWGHVAGTTVELLAPGGAVLDSEPADAQGASQFEDVEPGPGYAVRTSAGTSDPVTVLDPEDHPDQAFYDGVTVDEGYGYIPTRDGTLLSANVHFPIAGDARPWPVLVNYSGYDPSQTGDPPQEFLPFLLKGYVVVGVNMRGSGCSGGAFDYYEPATSTDGYDVVEALAAQDWSNGRIGLMGLSYSGISQLYVGATNPPHLEAITPLSAYGDAYRGILYPGGIRNEGFALNWALDRQAAAAPAARPWARARINGGDTTCRDNQVLRLQSRDMASEILPFRHDDPTQRHLDITSFADRIGMPTYLAAQFQDEQTGGSAVHLAEPLQRIDAPFRAVFTNGAHIDPFGPTEVGRLAEFVDFYVAKRKPDMSLLNALLPLALREIFGDPIDTYPNRFDGYATYEAALAAYEAEDPIRVRYENGGVAGREGAPYHTVENTYEAWPLPGTTAERWYLRGNGGLEATAPDVPDGSPAATSSYRYDPVDGRASTYDGSTESMWLRHPDVTWESPTAGTALTFTTPPATAKTVYAGTGSVDLWLRSSAADTDLEAVLTEVRPDGQEVYIQSGWLRASHRALDPVRSTELLPYSTHLEEDAAPLPAGELTPVRLALFPFAHIVRPGSRLRLSIEAPGGNQPYWEFTKLPGEAVNEVGHSVGRPSSLALPRVADGHVETASPAAAPSCNVPGVTVQSQSLRNQPCRTDQVGRWATGVTLAEGLRPGTAEVSWTPPAPRDGVEAPDGYQVALQPGGPTVSVPAGTTSTTVSSVPAGVALRATVMPIDDEVVGLPSELSPALTLRAWTPTERFVAAVHEDMLDRLPTPAERRGIADGIDAGTSSRGALLREMVRSEQWTDAIVDRFYLDTLGRPGDATGAAFWAGELQAGRLTVSQVAARFYASDEYYRGLGGGTVGTWVDDLYRKVLLRAPDAAGRAHWVDQVRIQGRVTVAWRFYQSAESARTRVRGLYRELLGRAPDGSGLSYWAGRVVREGDQALAVQLAASGEYLSRAQTRFAG